MELAVLLIFAGTLFAAAITPGPGVAALLARIFGHGMRGTPMFVVGMVFGDLFWFTLAILGMAAIATSYAMVFVALKWVGAAICFTWHGACGTPKASAQHNPMMLL